MTKALTDAAEKLKPALIALTASERLALATFLFDTVETEALSEEEFHAEWAAELNRRVKESEIGLDVEIPAEEVHRLVRESLS